MTPVSERDLPTLGCAAQDFSADRYRRQRAEAGRPGGVEGSYGTGTLPIIWPGSPGPSPNLGPGPDV